MEDKISIEKPGERALLAMKDQNKAVIVFKKPAVPIKKKDKKIILTEDKYIEEMGKIIQRDFFPDLAKLKAQNEYLDAIATNDVIKLRQIFNKYSKRRPALNETPAFDTPIPSSSPAPSLCSNVSIKTTSSTRSISDNHSLDSFFHKYTSEDNQSFEEIIEAADERLKQKFAILYEAEGAQQELLARSLALPSIENQFAVTDRPTNVDTWTYKNKNYIMYIPDGVDFTKAEKIEMAKLKQEITHFNTRLNSNPFNDTQNKETISELAKNQAKGNNNKVGFDGKTLDAATPEIRGFSFVKSPSPCPSLIDSSPLMTWGEIEGTPFRLDAGDTPLRTNSFGTPSFRIAETSKRENLALQLAEHVNEKHRAKKSRAIEAAKRSMCASPNMRHSLQRSSMSPAARKLRDSVLATPIPQNRLPQLTPRPIRKNSEMIKIRPKNYRRFVNPNRTPQTPNTPHTTRTIHTPTSNVSRKKSYPDSDATLTDNLLDIPTTKRQNAADFF